MPIRAATPDDLPAIQRIEQQSDTAAHWSLLAYGALFEQDAPRRRALVATNSGSDDVCGFIIVRSLADEWEIENLAVAPEQRLRGIASELLGELLRELQSAGALAVLLEVRESNRAARRLYEKHGFSLEGRRADYYRNPSEDALLLRRRLQLCDNIP